MKLIHKILLSYFLIILVIGSFSSYIMFYNIEKSSTYLEVNRENEIILIAELIDIFISDEQILQDKDKIQNYFISTINKYPYIKKLTLHAQDKSTIEYVGIASSNLTSVNLPSSQIIINSILNNNKNFLYTKGDFNENYLNISYPILGKNNLPIAALEMNVSLKESDLILKRTLDKMQKDTDYIILLAMTISILVMLLISAFMSKIIISPIKKLTRALSSVSDYNLEEEIDIYSNDEIGKLAQEFNKMTLELSDLYLTMDDQIIQKTQEPEEQFLTDSLTGLKNRYALFKKIGSLKDFHVAILDISSFKDINDAYGVDLGNKVLIDLGKKYTYYLLNTNLKLFRLSGDEVVILNNQVLSQNDFIDFIEDIIKKIEHEVFYSHDDDIEINISIHAGISFDSEHAIEKANIALIKTKKEHLDYSIFNQEIYDGYKQNKNIQTISKIKRGLANFGIIAHYQAIVDKHHKIIKYEALVRMKDHDKILSPSYFLDVAKKTKYYHEITKSIIFMTLDKFKDRDELISINICAEDITSKHTQNFIKHQLSIFKDPSRVIFELVESENIHNLPELQDFILYVKNLGAKIAIDDFGTGYSNFSYLMDLEPDYIKIDGSLIKNINTDQRSYAIVKTIVKFAHGLNIKVIAEYVHSKEVLKICEKLNIDEFQGYYFSEPSILN